MRALVLILLCAACTSEPVSRTVGARCDLDTECDQRCLTGGEYPGGFCSVACDNTSACPLDTACVMDQGGVCLFTCTGDRDCDFLGAGWTCKARDGKPTGTVMVCRGG